MDLSDGLADGVRQIAAASDVGITLDAAALPITDEVGAGTSATGAIRWIRPSRAATTTSSSSRFAPASAGGCGPHDGTSAICR